MAEIMITSFFTRGGVPASNIETLTPGYPIVRIWEVSSGSPAGDAFIGEFAMSPMEDGGNDDGFYKYEFTDIQGYDENKTYVFRSEGGASLPPHEQFQIARFEPDPQVAGIDYNAVADAVWDEDLSTHTNAGSAGNELQNIEIDNAAIADAVWNEPRADHTITGSTGQALNEMKADIDQIQNQLYLDANSVLEVCQLLLKLEAGRTVIDVYNNTLTVYDENCSTPLRVFKLYDHEGNESVAEVCERKPISKGPGDTTTITDVC